MRPSNRGRSKSFLNPVLLTLNATPGAEHESHNDVHEADHHSSKDHRKESHGHGHDHGDHEEEEKTAAGLSTSPLEDALSEPERHEDHHHEDQTHEKSHSTEHTNPHVSGDHGEEKKKADLSTSPLEHALGDSDEHEDHHHEDHHLGASHHTEKEDPHVSGEGAHSVAVGLIAGAIIIPLVIGMVLEEGTLGNLTFRLLDTFTSIFLAVLWFNTFSSIVIEGNRLWRIPYFVEVFSAIQVFVLYIIANAIAYLWRNNHLRMTTFCSIGAHFIAFAGIMHGSHLQHETSKMADPEIAPIVSFVFCFVTIVVLLGVSAVNQCLWRNKVEHHAMNHALDHLELDILGLVLSFLITQAVRHALRDQYPKMHLLLQEGQHNPHSHKEFIHPQWQCWFMLGWSVFLTITAGLVLPWLNQYREKGWVSKLIHVTKVTLIMLVAWGYILYGQWEFYERMFHGDAMFGHMVFAVLATAIGMVLLYIMAEIQGRSTRQQILETNRITVTGISLVVAWSWEHCFNIALDVIGKDYSIGYGGLVPKVVLAVAIPLVMLPVYFKHVRTRVINLPDEEG